MATVNPGDAVVAFFNSFDYLMELVNIKINWQIDDLHIQ
ncbi:hypothetical protein Niako_3895 [Niastella koreensis GR20-10]|uniref:Uncharacterized protein n=1 Tax=Niastella koreensis (strain DSM 17620 / KACC 11465 / NBRC 106392 / GR20-10) TaxID=700598 RepID=G8T8K8_NIAKG|nr:hypothetical protein Niako_3895 [Niastella koreensis GR20-10]